MMEWNAKSPLQWDWENITMFNSKATEYPKKSRPSEWVIDSEGFNDFGSLYSFPGGRVGSVSGSDVGHVSSKSSKSASINSSSIEEMKTSKFTLDSFNGLPVPEDFTNRKDFTKSHMTGTSPTFEPLLGLKLGRQTYFEDACVGSNSMNPSLTVIPMSYETPTKKSKTNCLSTHAQRCQVEDCNLNLSSAKDYHRKHRVCENHSKCPKVIVDGQERRFCQQCSRFHGLSEFDEKKRSCRRRLSDHNARRRKPKPEAVRLNQGSLSSSFNDMRQQVNVILNRAPLDQPRAATALSWASTGLPAFTQSKGYPFNPTKPGVVDGQQISFASNELPASVTRVFHDPSRLFPGKAANAEVLKGFEESGVSSNMEETHNLHRALSLLSTNSRSSGEPKAASRSSECWYTMQGTTKSEMHELASPGQGSYHFQELQLLTAPYDTEFYLQ